MTLTISVLLASDAKESYVAFRVLCKTKRSRTPGKIKSQKREEEEFQDFAVGSKLPAMPRLRHRHRHRRAAYPPKIFIRLSLFLAFILCLHPASASNMGVNWGTQASHPLPPHKVVQMLKDNGIKRVKLFDADDSALKVLTGTDIEVIVAIPNNMLQQIADTDSGAADSWVTRKIVHYAFEGGVKFKYVAVGNEPFLTSYNGTFLNLTFPALQNIQNALNNANLGDKIRATVPMNADVLENSALPSQGTFRNDSAQQMKQILALLHQNKCPFTINIYPFISLANSGNFPLNYVFFDSTIVQVQDGANAYANTFDASYDTLVAALANEGYPSMPIIVGEIGWPTNGFPAATPKNAQKFNQGFLNHVQENVGTPRRPNTIIEYYLFSLLDEDQKSIDPGNFERHWGIFAYDGTAKYSLVVPGASNNAVNNSAGGTLVNATGVEYLARKWCVVANDTNLASLADSVSYACANSDCTELGFGSSCNNVLDAKGNASYGFNQYFQMKNQEMGSCNFKGLASVTETDPSVDGCKFIVQIVASPAQRTQLLDMTSVMGVNGKENGDWD
ncbi:hypothetical protein GOP47_0011159 [Adiantum capillus-veneris]|uniref:glucan endo-1,3-beta-D-glucosidase n=1 Tax=Adiantum capillus-veneris TaxID=13818 RepID=A0A9D4USE4_ADICA|nr:hypothetical protein GOP47_0011159 [Adiantum capillus-veneris]